VRSSTACRRACSRAGRTRRSAPWRVQRRWRRPCWPATQQSRRRLLTERASPRR
jgi:hypothetical protein